MSAHRRGIRRASLCCMWLVGTVFSCAALDAGPLFFVSPGSNPAGDLAFQAALAGRTIVEEDFDSSPSVLTAVTAGPVTVSFSLPSAPVGGVETFAGLYGGSAGGQYGTVSGRALLNRRSGVVAREMDFTFDTDDVTAFGIWAFADSGYSDDSFTLRVEGIDGTIWTSPTALDNGHGSGSATDFMVEGFLGVSLASGIRSVTVLDAATAGFFELDHMQLAVSAPVPEPASAVLVLGMLAGALTTRRFRGLWKNRRRRT